MDPFGNLLPSCSWESPTWNFPGIEDTLAAMEPSNSTPLEEGPVHQPASILSDSELLGILSENIFDEMGTDDDPESDFKLDELEDLIVPDTPNDEWQPGNPSDEIVLPFTKTTGLKEVIADTPISYFEAIFNNELLSLLTRSTNEYGENLKAASRAVNSRVNFWKPISCGDLKLFFGLLFHMGFIKMNRLSDYWKREERRILESDVSKYLFTNFKNAMCEYGGNY